MFTLIHIVACILLGVALTELNCLPNAWEWWVILVVLLEGMLYGFHLGRKADKNKEETNNENR